MVFQPAGGVQASRGYVSIEEDLQEEVRRMHSIRYNKREISWVFSETSELPDCKHQLKL